MPSRGSALVIAPHCTATDAGGAGPALDRPDARDVEGLPLPGREAGEVTVEGTARGGLDLVLPLGRLDRLVADHAGPPAAAPGAHAHAFAEREQPPVRDQGPDALRTGRGRGAGQGEVRIEEPAARR